MESRTVELTSRYNGEVKANTIKGHFATKHSHVSHCLDTTRVKSELRMARAAAKSFAEQFSYTPVDTVLTLERTKMIGAFLARDLYNGGINLHHDVAVVTPEITDDKMILRDNLIPYLKDKHVLLMTASATTGMTILAALEGIRYYGESPSASPRFSEAAIGSAIFPSPVCSAWTIFRAMSPIPKRSVPSASRA